MNPSGRTGAFFDLDGTLAPFPSLEWRFVLFLIARKELDDAAGIRWLSHFAKNVLRDSLSAIQANKVHLAGLRPSLTEDWEDSLASRPMPFFARAVEQIGWHMAQGHSIFLVSGTIEPLARAVARMLSNCAGVCASTLEERDGRWTGRLGSEHMSGDEKARAVRRLATQYAIDLDRSYAYGNSGSDAPMLACVGHPLAVNPDAELREVARRRGWRACRWAERLALASELKPTRLFVPEAR